MSGEGEGIQQYFRCTPKPSLTFTTSRNAAATLSKDGFLLGEVVEKLEMVNVPQRKRAIDSTDGFSHLTLQSAQHRRFGALPRRSSVRS